ncbi:hypothetical protein CKM354_000785500 [Cercospora kikuchii]|uniref:Uncharacterized protein n=1 Tax=Cercospora kikuchii TaxID=84275 RepID=A0A9P3CHT9_9PEZI|nr:uncharacterized protein CKM354_000785500 [Cercospora kikuchii]GIZ44664.1 hypothetical protein CKM354_000785500 [Cercospora kikuchii]
MATHQTYLVTGATRGIGLAFVANLLTRSAVTVVAGVRDPTKASKILSDLPKATDSKLLIVKLDSSVDSDPDEAVAQLQKEYGVDALDVVIANARTAHSLSPIMQATTKVINEHFIVTTLGPLRLAQATAPLPKNSKSGRPVFLAITSFVGTISSMEHFHYLPNLLTPYGASKAALNWLVLRLHFEEKWLAAYVVHPGIIATDMVSDAMDGTSVDVKKLDTITAAENVTHMLRTVDATSREIGGTFQNYDGAILPW